MVWFTHDCPHDDCQAKNASFKAVHAYRNELQLPFIYTFSVCQVCEKPIIAIFEHSQIPSLSTDQFMRQYNQIKERIHLMTVLPKPESVDVPDHLPDNILSFFLEGTGSLPERPNAAGTMFRKTVDVTLKILLPEETGTFYNRINKARDDGLLTSDLAEWAHHVRLEGNDASHDEDPFTVEEAQSLERFTRLFLMYVFTLPGMLQDWRARAES